MRNRNGRLKLGFTVVAVALMSAFSAHSASAIEKVDDVKLAAQSGGTGYYSGSCAVNNVQKCTPASGCVEDAAANIAYTETFVARNSCSGSSVYSGNKTTARCARGIGTSLNTIYRQVYNHNPGTLGGHCRADARNSTQDTQYCSVPNCSNGAWYIP